MLPKPFPWNKVKYKIWTYDEWYHEYINHIHTQQDFAQHVLTNKNVSKIFKSFCKSKEGKSVDKISRLNLENYRNSMMEVDEPVLEKDDTNENLMDWESTFEVSKASSKSTPINEINKDKVNNLSENNHL